jgi:hypothetical protein
MTMSLTTHDDVRESVDESSGLAPAASPEQRRREARVDACRRAREHGDPGVGQCRYDDGCVALAVVGTGGPAQVRTLRSLRARLAREAWAELVVDLSGLDGDCGPALVRVLGQLRVHRLSAGARVEVHGAPPALTAEIGTRPATAYTVRDDPSDV